MIIEILIFATFLGFFGVATEYIFTSVPSKKHVGKVSLYMLPLYAVCLTLMFPPIMSLIHAWSDWIRYIVYGILIMIVEGLSGIFLHRILKRDVWTYPGRGFFKYTNLKMFPWWGYWGILVEAFINYLRSHGI